MEKDRSWAASSLLHYDNSNNEERQRTLHWKNKGSWFVGVAMRGNDVGTTLLKNKGSWFVGVAMRSNDGGTTLLFSAKRRAPAL